MQKMIKNIGLDVHKNSISIGIADDGRDGEKNFYNALLHQLLAEKRPSLMSNQKENTWPY